VGSIGLFLVVVKQLTDSDVIDYFGAHSHQTPPTLRQVPGGWLYAPK